MTDALRIGGLAVLSALIALILRRADRSMGAVVVICSGLMLLLGGISHLRTAANAIQQLSVQARLDNETASRLMKMLGITCITEWAAQLCRDAGEEGLAQKTAMAGKFLLLSMTIPMLLEIGGTITALIP